MSSHVNFDNQCLPFSRRSTQGHQDDGSMQGTGKSSQPNHLTGVHDSTTLSNDRVGTGPIVAKWLVVSFIVWGIIYPVARIEIIERTGVPSPLLGSWYDVLTFAALVLTLLSNKVRLNADVVTITVLGILLLGLVSALNTLVSGGSLTLVLYGARMTYWPMVYYFVGRWLPLSSRDIRRFHWILVIILGASALVGFLLSYVFRDYWIEMVILNAEPRGWGLNAIGRAGGLRMTGTLMDPTLFGTLSAYGVVFSTSLMRTIRCKHQFLIVTVVAYLCLLGTLLSLTRGAWGALLLSMISVSALLRNLKSWLKIFIPIIVIGGIMIMIPNHLDKELIIRTWQRTLEERSIQREDMWKDVINSVAKRPIGYGLGTVGHIGERFQYEIPYSAPLITDGWYLKVLAEGGFPLLMSFVFFQWLSLMRMFRLIKRTRDETLPFRVATFSIFLGACIQAVPTNIWDLFVVSHLLWLIVGLGTRPYQRDF
jgi:hypothetical protein